MRLDRERATDNAARAGKLLAAILAFVGIFGDFWLVLIALFIWFGAQHERDIVRIRSSLAGVTAGDVMSRRIEIVDADDPIATAATRMVRAGTPVLPVVDRGAMIGVITRDDLASGMRTLGADAPVADAPRHEVIAVRPDESVEHLLEDLQVAPGSIAVVVDDHVPIGLVTPDQLATYVALATRRDRAMTG